MARTTYSVAAQATLFSRNERKEIEGFQPQVISGQLATRAEAEALRDQIAETSGTYGSRYLDVTIEWVIIETIQHDDAQLLREGLSNYLSSIGCNSRVAASA